MKYWLAALLGPVIVFCCTGCLTTPDKPDRPVIIAPSQPQIVTVETIPAVCATFQGPVKNAQSQFGMVFKELQTQSLLPSGPPIALFYDPMNFDPDNAKYELCVPIGDTAKFINTSSVKTTILDGQKMASVIHEGSYETLAKSYERLIEFMEPYDIDGPSREVYLVAPRVGDEKKKNPKIPRTQILFPIVEKREKESSSLTDSPADEVVE